MCEAQWRLCRPGQLIQLGFLFLYLVSHLCTFANGLLKPIERLKFKEFNIYPDITLLPPSHLLTVSYHYKKVYCGNYLNSFEIVDAPVFLQWPRELGALYMLFLLGPDVPTRERPISRESQHWVIANIPGNRVDDGDTLVEYVGLTHHYKSGAHRFVFIVFKQPYNFTMSFELPRLSSKIVGKERLNFSFQGFVDKYYLGRPVASNFFQVAC